MSMSPERCSFRVLGLSNFRSKMYKINLNHLVCIITSGFNLTERFSYQRTDLVLKFVYSYGQETLLIQYKISLFD